MMFVDDWSARPRWSSLTEASEPLALQSEHETKKY